jgi:uncharacterized protein YprB with RNaseH-like and TPR domain
MKTYDQAIYQRATRYAKRCNLALLELPPEERIEEYLKLTGTIRVNYCKHDNTVDPNTAQASDGCPIHHSKLISKGKVAFWDIEANEVRDAGFGFMYCFVLKILDGPRFEWQITQKEIMDGVYDKSGCEAFKRFIIENDIQFIVTWFGTWYDLRFMRLRSILTGGEFFKYGQLYHWDLWKVAKNKMMFGSNRMGHVADEITEWAEFMGNEGLPGKSKVKGITWVRAQIGDKECLDQILEHCRKDILVLEAVYKKFDGYWRKSWTSI